MKIFLPVVAAIVAAVLASPAAANDDWYQRAVKAAEKARNTPEAQAENHGYATAAYEKVCGPDLVVTDAKLRAKKDRLYRNHPAYAYGYRWVANQADAAFGIGTRPINWVMIYNFCTGAEMAGWAEIPAARKEVLEESARRSPGR